MVAKRLKKSKTKKTVTKQKKFVSKISKIAPTPMRNSKHAEEQSMKIFLVAGLSIILIVILALFLFYQDDAVAGQAVGTSSLDSSSCGTDGDLCFLFEGSDVNLLEGAVGEEFTIVIAGYTANEVYSGNFQIVYPEYFELDIDNDGLTVPSGWEFWSNTTGSTTDSEGVSYTGLDFTIASLSDMGDGDHTNPIEFLGLTFTIASSAVTSDTYTISFEELTSDGESTGFFQSDGTANLVTSQSVEVNIIEDLAVEIETGATTSFTEGESGTVEIGAVVSGGSESYTDMEVRVLDPSSSETIISAGDSYTNIDGTTSTPLQDDSDNTWSFSMDYDEFSEGVYTLTFEVMDSNGDVAEINNVLTVLAVVSNNAPAYGDITDNDVDGDSDTSSMTITEGDSDSLEIDITASDIDGDDLTLAVDLFDSSGTSQGYLFEDESSIDFGGQYMSLTTGSASADGDWDFTITDLSFLTADTYTITFYLDDGEAAPVQESYTLMVESSSTTGTSCNYAGGTSTTETDYVTDKEGVCSGYACYVDEMCASTCSSDGHCDDNYYCSSDGACEVDDDSDGYTSSDDCDDEDSSVYQYLTLYTDADGDGYGDDQDTGDLTCVGESYSGYSTENSDCDDTDNTLTTDCSTDDNSDDDETSEEDTSEEDTSEEDTSESEDGTETSDDETDTDEISIAITDSSASEVSVTDFSEDSVYDIEVIVTPTEGIDEHLLIVSVADSNGVVQSLIYQSMGALAAGESESQSLSYTAASSESHTVSVFVWAGWADDGDSTSLIDSVVVNS
jgi:hypothetical protein